MTVTLASKQQHISTPGLNVQIILYLLRIYYSFLLVFSFFVSYCLELIPSHTDHKCVLFSPSCEYPLIRFLHSNNEFKWNLQYFGSKIIMSSPGSFDNMKLVKLQSGLQILNFQLLFLFLLSLPGCWLMRSHKISLSIFMIVVQKEKKNGVLSGLSHVENELAWMKSLFFHINPTTKTRVMRN